MQFPKHGAQLAEDSETGQSYASFENICWPAWIST